MATTEMEANAVLEARDHGAGATHRCSTDALRLGSTWPGGQQSLSNKLLGNRAIPKFIKRTQSRTSMFQLNANNLSHWRKLRQRDNPKKLKMVGE